MTKRKKLTLEEECKFQLWQRCGNCRFYEWGDADSILCVRRAPTIDPSDGESMGIWPVVHEGFWCGEWEYSESGHKSLPAKAYAEELAFQREMAEDEAEDPKQDPEPTP